MNRPCKLTVVVVAAALVAVALALVGPALSGAQSEGDLRNRADRARAREQGLSGDVARLGRLVNKLDNDIAVIERRRAEVQVQLDADRARLATLREELRAERRRVVRLRARLREARQILSARLVELYQTPQPDLVRVRAGERAGREGRWGGLAGLRRFADGAFLESGWVQFDGAGTIAVPLADLERFG